MNACVENWIFRIHTPHTRGGFHSKECFPKFFSHKK